MKANTRSRIPFRTVVPLFLACCHSVASAATLEWDNTSGNSTAEGGTGTWNTSNTNWLNGTTNVAFVNNDDAVFGGSSGTVTLGGNLSARTITFNTDNYNLSGTTQILTINPTVAGTGLVVGGAGGNTSFNIGTLALNGNSGSTYVLKNIDKISFNNTIVAFRGGRTWSLDNTTASATANIAKLAATWDQAPNSHTLALDVGNLNIQSLSAGVLNNAFAQTTSGIGTLTIAGSGAGTVNLGGNNTTFSATGTGTMAFRFNNAAATLLLGDNNALGARDAASALTATVFDLSAGTVGASGGGTRTISNLTTLTGNATIGGSQAITFDRSFTNSGGSRTLTVSNSAVTTLSGNVYLSESATTGRTLTIGAGNLTISGLISDFNGSGLAGGLTKSGAGNLTLGNAGNTYTGLTTVDTGTMTLTASATVNNTSGVNLINSGTFDVSAKGVGGYIIRQLTGSGTVRGVLTVSTRLAIGASPGTVTFDNNLTLGASSVSDFEFTNTAFGAGTYDLAQDGASPRNVTFGGTLNLIFAGGTYQENTPIKIFDFETYSGNFTNGVTVTGLTGFQSAIFNPAAGTVTVVPEPAVVLLGGFGLIPLLVRRRVA